MFKHLPQSLTIYCFLFLGMYQAVAQSTPTPTKVIPASPDAAALMKFADIPVSTYTGTPNIDIPLYTIQSGDITVPISLAYHASGIKLSEEASSVGLGWALNAGGAVSRNILDKDDFNEGAYFTTAISNIAGKPTALIHSRGDNVNEEFKFATAEGEISLKEGIRNPLFYDLEADNFSYNFLSSAGKFILDRQRKAVLNKQQNIKVVPEATGQRFIIIDENGFTYYFNQPERSGLASENKLQITSWYLTEIVSPTKSRVKFIYEVATNATYVNLGDSETYRENCFSDGGPALSVNSNGQSVNYTVSLKRIEFAQGFVEFLYPTNREDLPHGKKLEHVQIFSQSSQQTKLLKQFDLSYSYFNQALGTSNYKRLRLDKITEKAGGLSLPPYLFTYQEPTANKANLTAKTSKSIDHWGYFNGAEQQTLLPAYKGIIKKAQDFSSPMSIQEYFKDLPGANRNSHPADMKVFSLTGITYPTGGKTGFELEAHDYDEVASRDSTSEFEELNLQARDTTLLISTTSSGTIDLRDKYGPNVTYTVGFIFSNPGDNQNVATRFPYGSIYFEFDGIRRDLAGDFVSCPSDGKACTATVDMQIPGSGLFSWQAGVNRPTNDNTFQFMSVKISWTGLKRLQNTNTAGGNERYVYAGGLRVKQITTFDINNQPIKKRRYDYHYQVDSNGDNIKETYSYGKRMSPPSYNRYQDEVGVANPGSPNDEYCGICLTFIRTANSVTALSTSAQGSVVGYDQVTEYVTDKDGGTATLGKTEYLYENRKDILGNYAFVNGLSTVPVRLPGLMNLTHSSNGLLKEKIDYSLSNGTYKRVQSTQNKYRLIGSRTYYNTKFTPAQVCHLGGAQTTNVIYFYPALQADRIELDSTITYLFDGNNTIATSQKFYYTTVHNQPIKQVTYSSDGKAVTVLSTYVQDNISGLSSVAQAAKDTLVARHIYTPVLEKSVWKQNTLLSRTRHNYKVFGSNLVLPENIELQHGSGPTEKRLEFKQYDEAGNLLQQAKVNDAATAYLWGYNKVYPIAEVQNAASSQIFHTSFEEAGTVSSLARTGRRIHTGSYSFTLPTQAGKYLLTYWRKPTNSTTWTYVSESIDITSTGPSSKSLGDASTDLDEVRFYPATAQMTTYTYDPLVGMTSSTDANHYTTYFIYDAFGRLALQKNNKGQILKKYEYQYANQ